MARARTLPTTAAVLGLLLGAVLGGCELASDPSPDPTTTASTTATTTPPEDVEPSPTESATEPAEPTPPAEDELPGEAFDRGPGAGDSLVIIGVSAQEILNLRIGPGIDFDPVARMPADTVLAATGRARDLGGGAGVWYQVRATVDGVDDVGWVLSSYTAQRGARRTVTDQFDPPPTSRSRSGLVDAVVAAWDRSPDASATVVFGPVERDDLQVTVDVLTGGDDSVVGARLVVVAAVDDGRYTVTRVTATQLCARGVSGTGDCV